MGQAKFWVCSSQESDGVEMNCCLDNYVQLYCTCDLLKKVPRPVGSQKMNKSTLLHKDFKQEKTILQNLDFQIFQRSSQCCGKNKIYTYCWLGSMLVAYYVSQHARLATAASTISSGFCEPGSLGSSYEQWEQVANCIRH